MAAPSEGFRIPEEDYSESIPLGEAPTSYQQQLNELLVGLVSNPVHITELRRDTFSMSSGESSLDITLVHERSTGDFPPEYISQPIASTQTALRIDGRYHGTSFVRTPSEWSYGVAAMNGLDDTEVLEGFVSLLPGQEEWLREVWGEAGGQRHEFFDLAVEILADNLPPPFVLPSVYIQRTTSQRYQNGATLITRLTVPPDITNNTPVRQVLERATAMEILIVASPVEFCRYEKSMNGAVISGAGNIGFATAVHDDTNLQPFLELLQTTLSAGEKENTSVSGTKPIGVLSAAAISKLMPKMSRSEPSAELFRRIDGSKYAELQRLLGRLSPLHETDIETAIVGLDDGRDHNLQFKVEHTHKKDFQDMATGYTHTEEGTLVVRVVRPRSPTLSWSEPLSVDAERIVWESYDALHAEILDQDPELTGWIEQAWDSLFDAVAPGTRPNDARSFLRRLPPSPSVLSHAKVSSSKSNYCCGNGTKIEYSSVRRQNLPAEPTRPSPSIRLNISDGVYCYELAFRDRQIRKLVKQAAHPANRRHPKVDILQQLSAERTNEVLGELLGVLEAGINSDVLAPE